ncbi:MAG: mandelate racemase/muconate lactonizing enzyme family protein [Deltaproteobacteria bacterium]|nr:mandelate racemase/muconate lactonizing enzyme family protein [Deltaproteobacteria bacterium]
MKVVQMETTAVSLPMPHRVFFGKENPHMTPVIVELKTDGGLEGFGIAYCMNDFQVNSLKASIDDLEEVVIGQDITRWAANWKDLHAALKHTGQWGGYGLNAIAAIDTAFWDLRAKALNLPLARLLGGFRDRVPAYASNWLWGFLSIDELQEEAESLVKQGHRAMKMKMGGKTHRENVARFRAVREAVGEDIDIMVEGHWSWTVPEAIRMGHALEPYNPYWLEDPIGLHQGDICLEDTAALAQIKSAVDVPVAAGETFSTKYGFRRMVEDKAVDIVIVDVLRAGGITEMMKIAALIEAYNLPLVSHCLHDVSVHIIAGLSNGHMVEYMPWWDEIYQEPPRVIDGHFEISEKPGLGLELDRTVINKYKLR